MNFTKEYLKLCKDKRIMGLKLELQLGDWILDEDETILLIRGVNEYYLTTEGTKLLFDRKDNVVWLPTGDQLDEEIIKICKEKNLEYAVFYSDNKCIATFEPIGPIMEGLKSKQFENNNPLIAKIKLLLKLKG